MLGVWLFMDQDENISEDHLKERKRKTDSQGSSLDLFRSGCQSGGGSFSGRDWRGLFRGWKIFGDRPIQPPFSDHSPLADREKGSSRFVLFQRAVVAGRCLEGEGIARKDRCLPDGQWRRRLPSRADCGG